MDKQPLTKPKAIITDVDQTLTERTTWYELTEKLGGSARKHAEIFAQFLKNHISYDQMKKELFAMWTQNGPVHKDRLMDIFLTVPLRGEAFALFNELQARGFELCLISSSIELFIETVAKRFSIQRWYGNSKLIFDEQGNWIDFEYTKEEALLKKEQLADFLQVTGYAETECIAIGDGDNDIEIFQRVPGIVVGQSVSPHLRELAWNEVQYLSKVIQIVESI